MGEVEQIKFNPKRNIKSRVVVLTRKQFVIYKNNDQMVAKLQKNAIDLEKITKISEFKDLTTKPSPKDASNAAQIGYTIEIQCNEFYKKFKPKERDAKTFII